MNHPKIGALQLPKMNHPKVGALQLPKINHPKIGALQLPKMFSILFKNISKLERSNVLKNFLSFKDTKLEHSNFSEIF